MELEIASRTKLQETTALAPRLTVEHVLPEKWETHWLLRDGVPLTKEEKIQAIFATTEDDTRLGQIVTRNRLLHTIGNLTILTKSLNSSVSNGPWEGKRKALLDHSLLVMNREITRENTWTEDKIEARSRTLFKIAKSIWPLTASLG
jgi:hypothetical protein